jgi:hypothetical protein
MRPPNGSLWPDQGTQIDTVASPLTLSWLACGAVRRSLVRRARHVRLSVLFREF